MDSDENEDELYFDLVQRLPVATFDNYDPDTLPENGADYLRRVQLESEKEPKIKVAENYHFNYTNSFNSNLDEFLEDDFIKLSPKYIITENIVPLIIESFEKLRKNINEFRNKNNDKKCQPIKLTKKRWREYCFNESEHNSERKNIYKTKVPKIGLIAELSEKELLKLLSFHCEWLNEDGDSLIVERCLWIYSLLAALNTIQLADTYSLLRQLSRQCSQIRYRIQSVLGNDISDDECSMKKISSLSLIIVLIGHYFKQKDLLDF